ncbi:7TM diverse intracellular signaling domain-containing protein [uncultured Marivirga sp.]|uniref:7TM diverse intracellular signaling domain-containing protein n=1 Tax=uncultured Marivirga sp. TaxID=1123707 RepID=UPI0030EDBE70|tara:strand:+ start:225197 stop:227362 length:2166 start_codon:yes stop_codon:yes gene_type:complete
MISTYWRFLFALLFISNICESFALNNISIQPNESFDRLGKQIQFLEDIEHQLTFQEILSPKYQSLFKYGKQEIPTYGLKDLTLWVKIEIEHFDQFETSYVLEIGYPTFDSITYFILQESTIIDEGFLGDRIKFSEREIRHKNFIIPLELNKGNRTSIYLKIRNKGSIILPISIKTKEQLFAEDISEEISYGIFYGIMLVMLLYNLLLAFSARSISYIYYVGIITGNLLTLSALNGHAFMYLWYDLSWWANHVIVFGIGLWILASNQFALSFLETKKYFPRYHWVFRFMKLVAIVIIILAFTADYAISLKVANYSLLINCLVLLFSGIYFWSKKVKVAGIFTLAWSVYLIGVLLYTLRNLGFLPVTSITSHVLEFGAIAEVILLSVSLGYKYRLLETDKKAAQENAMDLMAQSQKLVQEQNEELERQVSLRTAELEQKQEEILTQNEELNSKNESLLEAQQIIKAQNTKLKEYTDDLEAQVAKRTSDLESTNAELAQNVQKLEQYAFMTAHNLRAPVARLLGLTHLLEISPDTEKSDWLDIISKIKEEGDSLDSVIKDLNAILDLRKEVEEDKEWIDLSRTLAQTKRILKNSIELSGAEINFDNSAFNEIECNPTYVDSIFYNLISNAIKYRSYKRKLKLMIGTKIYEDKKIISFADNGMGIDLEKNKDKLFGMYRRFHTHVEGKGLGLYLVKSQMEILGGKIQVNSEIDKGTTFTLLFPFT